MFGTLTKRLAKKHGYPTKKPAGSEPRYSSRWSFLIGRYITDRRGRRHRIKAILDANPPDRSVGIWFGSVTVETSDDTVYSLTFNGKVERWKDPFDCDAGIIKDGTHSLFAE